MSETQRDPTTMGAEETDDPLSAEQDAQVWGDAGGQELDEVLGEALEEVLSDAATLVAEEAMAEAGEPRRRKKRKKAGKQASGSRFRRVDGTLAIVLFSNLLFMGLILFLPEPPAKTEDIDPRAGHVGTGTPNRPETEPVLKPRPAVESRVIQLAEIEGLVRVGRFEEAIQGIEDTIQGHPNLPPMVRRSLYSRLANYCAEAGNHDKALKYLKLSSNGFQMSLMPQDLWKMALDASKLGDQPGSRRYLARFLLQESLMNEEMESRVPAAYLRLGDGYRIQASEAEKARRGK